jgi:hypothetical protein
MRTLGCRTSTKGATTFFFPKVDDQTRFGQPFLSLVHHFSFLPTDFGVIAQKNTCLF